MSRKWLYSIALAAATLVGVAAPIDAGAFAVTVVKTDGTAINTELVLEFFNENGDPITANVGGMMVTSTKSNNGVFNFTVNPMGNYKIVRLSITGVGYDPRNIPNLYAASARTQTFSVTIKTAP